MIFIAIANFFIYTVLRVGNLCQEVLLFAQESREAAILKQSGIGVLSSSIWVSPRTNRASEQGMKAFRLLHDSGMVVPWDRVVQENKFPVEPFGIIRS
jgi:hypothetical protein